jgi:hypothetical protein
MRGTNCLSVLTVIHANPARKVTEIMENNYNL